MCVSCFTSADALAWNAVGGAAVVSESWRQLRLRRAGWTRTEIRRSAWDENARFLEQLGHDPAMVLGARPGAVDAPVDDVALRG